MTFKEFRHWCNERACDGCWGTDMYKSPIDIIYGQMEMQLEGEVMTAVQKVGVDVDKDELIRALRYDRNQYKKGYADGAASTVVHGRWKPADDPVLYNLYGVTKCSVCGYEYAGNNMNYCPDCGAKMDGEVECD